MQNMDYTRDRIHFPVFCSTVQMHSLVIHLCWQMFLTVSIKLGYDGSFFYLDVFAPLISEKGTDMQYSKLGKNRFNHTPPAVVQVFTAWYHPAALQPD